MMFSNKAGFLLMILLLSLVLCSFLGGNCMQEGFVTGSNALVTTGILGNTSAIATGPNGSGTTTDLDTVSNKTFYGANGGSAQVVNNNGNYLIQITDANGNTNTYTYNNTNTNNTNTTNNNTNTTNGTSGTVSADNTIVGMTFTGPLNGKATVVKDNNNNYTIVITYPSGEKIVYHPDNSTTSTNSTTNTNTNNYNPNTYYPATATVASVTGPQGNSWNYAQGPMGNSVSGVTTTSNNSNGDYNSSLPAGIPASNIPYGSEDLYILKSSVVPPVCPVAPPCPQNCNKNKDTPPPCPPCARCPEPSMTCKAVPNYSQGAGANNQYLPIPVLSSFSSFGM